jgi:hypothetical protein
VWAIVELLHYQGQHGLRDAVLLFNVGSTVTVVLPWDCQAASVGGLSRFSTIPSVFVPLSVGLLVPLDLLYRRSGRGIPIKTSEKSARKERGRRKGARRMQASHREWTRALCRSMERLVSDVLIGIIHFL